MPSTKSKFGKPKSISTVDFDAKFNAGEDISEHLDFSSTRIVEAAPRAQKVNVDFPVWVVKSLDKEAERIGIARQALIKLWIVERLESNPRAVRYGESQRNHFTIDRVMEKAEPLVAGTVPETKRAVRNRAAAKLAGAIHGKRPVAARGAVGAVANSAKRARARLPGAA